MLVDSHCHIDFPELADKLDSVFELMRENEVERALCISVTLEDFPRVRKLAETYPHIHGSVGVHPQRQAIAKIIPTIFIFIVLLGLLYPSIRKTQKTGFSSRVHQDFQADILPHIESIGLVNHK